MFIWVRIKNQGPTKRTDCTKETRETTTDEMRMAMKVTLILMTRQIQSRKGRKIMHREGIKMHISSSTLELTRHNKRETLKSSPPLIISNSLSLNLKRTQFLGGSKRRLSSSLIITRMSYEWNYFSLLLMKRPDKLTCCYSTDTIENCVDKSHKSNLPSAFRQVKQEMGEIFHQFRYSKTCTQGNRGKKSKKHSRRENEILVCQHRSCPPSSSSSSLKVST